MLDIWIIEANGKATRPWLTAIMDDHSRAIAGYLVFLGAPSALQTSLALRQAIWRKQTPDWPIWGRLREGAESYAKALANDILR